MSWPKWRTTYTSTTFVAPRSEPQPRTLVVFIHPRPQHALGQIFLSRIFLSALAATALLL